MPERLSRLDDRQRAAVRRLAAGVARLDGAEPLSDQTLLQLGRDEPVHLISERDEQIVGYAQVAGGVGEVLVGPVADRDDLAESLLTAVAEADAELVWAHGERSPVAAVLQRGNADVDRTLLQLRRPATDVEAVPVPDGVTLRAFVVGRDEDAWLAVNARAFAHHREQGGWTRTDIEEREREDWFDPAGFLLAVDEQSGDLLGFHWTKLHGRAPDDHGDDRGDDGTQTDDAPVGEVYVIAVDPAAQGRGLSKVLLAAGLRHLRERGAAETVLYTDGDNTAAIHLYEKAGFVRARTDVQYRLTGPQVQTDSR